LDVEAAVVAVPAEQFDLLPEQLQKLLKLGARLDCTGRRMSASQRKEKEWKERTKDGKKKRQEKKERRTKPRRGEAVPLEKNSFSFVWWASQ
jgi:hypothetical protein